MFKDLESIEIVLKDGYRRVAFKLSDGFILTYDKKGNVIIGDISLTDKIIVGKLEENMGFGDTIDSIMKVLTNTNVNILTIRKCLYRFYGIIYCNEPIDYNNYNKIKFKEDMNCYSLDFGRGEVLTGGSNKFVVANGYNRSVVAVKVCNKENVKLIEELCIRMNIINTDLMEVKDNKNTVLYNLLETLYENTNKPVKVPNIMFNQRARQTMIS